jgi:hypothetical protein
MSTLVEKSTPEALISAVLERWSPALYLVLMLALCALEIALGAMPTRVYAHDYFIFLDGAWRMVNGQIPNRDFYSGYGTLVWNPLRWALSLYGYDINALGLVRALYTGAIGVWFFLLSRLMPRGSLSVLPGIFLLVFVSAARPLGEYPTWISHSMFYDRAAYALVMLIIFDQFHLSRFEPIANAREAKPAIDFLRGVSTGAALLCASLIKASFLVPGVLLLVAGLLLFGIHRRQLAGVLAGGLAAFVCAVACLHLQPLLFLREVIAPGQQFAAITGEALRTLVNEAGMFFFILAAGFVVVAIRGVARSIALKYLLATVVIAGCDLYCRATDSLNADLPLASFWCLTCAIMLLAFPVATETAKLRRQQVMAMLVLCALAVPIFADDLASTLYATLKTISVRHHAAPRIDAARLRRWDPQDWLGKDPNFIGRNGQHLVQATNDGIHLLQRASRPDETVFCIAYANPFPFALDRKPSPGGTLTLNSVSVAHPVQEENVIGHPDLLMVEQPNLVEQDSMDTILALYPGLLTREFTQVAKSDYWTLYRRQ